MPPCIHRLVIFLEMVDKVENGSDGCRVMESVGDKRTLGGSACRVKFWVAADFALTSAPTMVVCLSG